MSRSRPCEGGASPLRERAWDHRSFEALSRTPAGGVEASHRNRPGPSAGAPNAPKPKRDKG
jgi:hypothetical protein